MTTRDELLTKLAAECATWDEANSIAVHSECLRGNQQEGFPGFSKGEWLAERERLLNKPDWPDDKKWKWRAVDSNGEWYFYRVEPGLPKLAESPKIWFIGNSASNFSYSGANALIPAGYDWRDSLEERP